jgi:pilus assembly protein CpaB
MLLGLALLLAVVTIVLVRNLLQPAKVAQAPKRNVQQVEVLVSSKNLHRGQILRAADMRWQPWPKNGVSPSYAVSGKLPMKHYVGAVVRDPVANGEPISENKVVRPGERGFLAAVLQPGMRATSVPVNLTTGISGFVFPGDKVDLILTHTISRGGRDVRASETLIRNVRVLAIDQSVGTNQGQAKPGRTATLEVTPKQSEIIALIMEMGKLSLSLRSIADDEADKPMAQDGDSGPDAKGAAAAEAKGGPRVNEEAMARLLDSSRAEEGATYTLDTDASLVLRPKRRNSGPKVQIIRGESRESQKVKE